MIFCSVFSLMLSEIKPECESMDSSLLQLPVCLLILIFLKSLFTFNFHFSVKFCNRFSINYYMLETQHNFFHSLFALSDPFITQISYVFYDSSIKWCWRWSTLNFLGMVTIVFLLLNKSLLYSRSIIMFINSCLYCHCCPTGNNSDILCTAVLPACYSKATLNRGLPLLGFHLFFTRPIPLMCLPFISTVEQTLG